MKIPTLLLTLTLLVSGVSFAQGRDANNQSGTPLPEPPVFQTDDPVQYGLQIAAFADRYEQGYKDEILQGEMTLFDADGDSVRRSFTRMVLEQPESGDKLITKFLSPAEIKGVAALTHENSGSSDDNWLYLPANKRVRRISGANNTASFQGTEFTYEDLSNLDPEEYEWRFLEEGSLERDGAQIAVFKLDARPTYSDTGYSRIVVYYNAKEWRQERVEYYDKAGKHLKTRDSSDWKLMHGRFWRAHQLEMLNHQTKKRTTLAVSKYFVNLSLYTSSRTGKPRENLKDEMFTTRALES